MSKEGAFSSEEKKKIQKEKEENWVLIQIKGLSAWLNSYLQRDKIPLIQNLQKDLQDGVKLNQFLCIVSGKKLVFDLTPQMKIHKIQNLSTAINFIQEDLAVRLVGISAEDIERGDIKLILGLIYSVFRGIRISQIATQIGETDKKKSEAQQLIAWMNTIVEKEPYELKLETFRDDNFKTGKAFGALLHAYNPELLEYEDLGTDGEENLKKIFEIYEQKLGIPQLLDVAEVVNGTVDERAMTLYSSLIYHAHASQEERRKLENNQQQKEAELNKEKLNRKDLENKYGQLQKDNETLQQERERLERERQEQQERANSLEELRRKLEEEAERLRREKEELDRQRLLEIQMREKQEGLNSELVKERERLQKELEEEEKRRKLAEEEKKRLLKQVEEGLANQLLLRDQMLYLYNALMDERYDDIEEFLRKLAQSRNQSGHSSGSGQEGSSQSGQEGSSSEHQGGESSSSSRNLHIHKSGEQGESGSHGDEGSESLRKTRTRKVPPPEAPHIDLSSDHSLEEQRKRNTELQHKLQKQLEELEDRLHRELNRRRKDAQKLQDYEERLKAYEKKAIEQGEANRALDILKKNLTEHVEDLKAWVDLSELDLHPEKLDKYDPSLLRANLKDKKFEEQIDYLAEQLQGENESMRRILQVKDSKKQLYDSYADKAGWLLMKTEEGGTWKNQWFVLKSSDLSYYPSEEKSERAGGLTIDANCVITSQKMQVSGSEKQTVYPIKISLKEGASELYIAATTKKAKKEWAWVLKGKIISSTYLKQVEESKTRPDPRLNNVLFATVDLGSIRLDNAPISKYTVWGIANSLSSFEDINVLTFSSSEFTDEHAGILAPALSKSFVRKLDFSDNHLTSEGAKAIAASLVDNRSLESLNFSTNELGNECAESLSALLSHHKITSLNLKNNKITSEGAQKIFAALAEHPKWTHLQFSGNQIGDEGCKFVAELIAKNGSITELKLARNRIGDEGVKALCGALKENTSVTRVDLSGNLLTQQSVAYLNELLHHNKTIKLVELSSNPQIVGGKGLEGAFSNESFSLSSFSLLRIL